MLMPLSKYLNVLYVPRSPPYHVPLADTCEALINQDQTDMNPMLYLRYITP